MSKKSVFLIYGFAEGNWHGKKFKQELIKAGFEIADHVDDADIIVAHSGGCFYLPEAKPGQLTVLIGPPYWPGKSVVTSMTQKIWSDAVYCLRDGHVAYWLQKTFWNGVYTLASIKRVIQIALNAQRHNFYLALNQREVIIIRANNDCLLTPNYKTSLHKHAQFQSYDLPGQHDDCWLDPTPYVKVLKSYV
jgi:hypothetical protein